MAKKEKSATQIRKEKVEHMKSLILNASEAEIRKVFIPLIMDRQSMDEKEYKHTTHKNGIGLSAAHAPQITLYYELVEQGFRLFPIQVRKAREILSCYAGQFVECAEQSA